jgi:hypothetical protein
MMGLEVLGEECVDRHPTASDGGYPNVLVAAGFHSTTRPVFACATITASRTLSKSLPMPRSWGRMAREYSNLQRLSCFLFCRGSRVQAAGREPGAPVAYGY